MEGGIFAHSKMRDVICERPHICFLSEIISRNEAFEITFQLETRVMLETDENSSQKVISRFTLNTVVIIIT